MCRLMVYHPASKSWQLVEEETSISGSMIAIVHETDQNSEQINPITYCLPKQQKSASYIPCTEMETFCKECLRLLQFVCHNEDMANQQKGTS